MGKRINALATLAKNVYGTGQQFVSDDGTAVTKVPADTMARATLEQYAGSSLGGSSRTVKSAIDAINTTVASHETTLGTATTNIATLQDDVADLQDRISDVEAYASWGDIAHNVSIGRQPYQVGDTFSEPWVDTALSRSYDNPWRVNGYETVTLENGETVKGMWLQNVYAHPLGVQFSHQRAFLACPNGLSAGTYYITLGSSWGSKDAVANTHWHFTLTKNVPEGGRLAGFYGMPDQLASTWKVYSYAADGKTLSETVNVSSGATGTSLGTLALNTRNGNINSMQEVAYGWNRWETSALRQYLNSDAQAGAWWTPQDAWDIAPDQLASKPGFLSGLPKGMIDVMIPCECVTYKNTVQDGGTADITYDKVRLISLGQMYVNPQVNGEGNVQDYWKQLNGTNTPWAQSTAYEALIHYAVENHSSAQNVRLRCATRGTAHYTWYVGSSGAVGNYHASHALRFAPLVLIG